MPNILFVCTANQCRSPIAEALFVRRLQHLANQLRVGQALPIHCSSAGTLAENGHPPIPAAIKVMRDIGLDITSHRSRPISRALLEASDLIVVMSKHQKEAIRAEFRNVASHVVLLSELATIGYDIPDPAGGDVAEVRRVAQEIDRLLEKGMADMLQRLGLSIEAAAFQKTMQPVSQPAPGTNGAVAVITKVAPVARTVPSEKPAPSVRIHPSADVGARAVIGAGSRVWNNAQVRDGACIGDQCIIGKNVYIDADVRIGNRVKIQNNVSVFHGVTLEEGVFVGPHVCFTNDLQPRAIGKDGALKAASDWTVTPTLVKYGAGIGANSTIRCGVTIGRWAMIGAGSVVTKDVPDYGLAYGNPARLRGYVCPCGERLEIVDSGGQRIGWCGKCGEQVAVLSA